MKDTDPEYERAAGKIKEAIGTLTGDKGIETEDCAQKLKGRVTGAGDDARAGLAAAAQRLAKGASCD